MQFKKLYSESLHDEPSLRSLIKDPSLVPNYCFNKTIISLMSVLKTCPVYKDIEEFWDNEGTKVISGMKALINQELLKDTPDLFPVVSNILLNDNILFESMLAQAAYHNSEDRKNYIISPSFWAEFKNVSIENLRFKDLPEGAGYIHLPDPIVDEDGTAFQHYFFVCGSVQKNLKMKFHRRKKDEEHIDRVLVTALISDQDQRRVLGVQFPKNEEIKLSDYFQDAVMHHYNYGAAAGPSVSRRNYDAFTGQMLNLLAYIGSGQPDISQFRNKIEYRGNTKTPTNKHRDLSLSDLYLVGFNWLKDKIYKDDEWTVRSHLRWQRYGENRSKVKLVTVSEHEKKWRKPVEHPVANQL